MAESRRDPRSDEHPEQDSTPDPTSGSVDLEWARRQRLLAVIGSLLCLLALLATLLALPLIPGGYGVTAVVGAAVLLIACLVLLLIWHRQLRGWERGDDAGFGGRFRVSLVAHLVSYAAVLVTMYGALAGIAIALWTGAVAVLLGAALLLAVVGQILAGTQLLRRSGPPRTIPEYLRQLNAKVQSLR